MQTFLPYKDYSLSANALDTKRLRKQIIEGLQIYNALLYPEYGWQSHPAVQMWRGAEFSLLDYVSVCHYQYVIGRGHQSHQFDTNRLEKLHGWLAVQHENPNADATVPTWGVLNLLCRISNYYTATYRPHPQWLGNPDFHEAHRSNLVRKDPVYYRPKWPDVPDDLPYIWPSIGRVTPKKLTLFPALPKGGLPA